MTPNEKHLFCRDGRIITAECRTTDNRAYFDTGEIVSCNVDQGLICENVDNFPACQYDYMIRYQCEETTCHGKPQKGKLPYGGVYVWGGDERWGGEGRRETSQTLQLC